MAEHSRVVAEVLWRLRRNADYSQEQAAAEVGVSQATWSRWEKGLLEPTTREKLAIARAFKFGFASLLEAMGYTLEEERLTIGQWVDRRQQDARYNRADGAQENTAPGGGIAVPQPPRRGNTTELYQVAALAGT